MADACRYYTVCTTCYANNQAHCYTCGHPYAEHQTTGDTKEEIMGLKVGNRRYLLDEQGRPCGLVEVIALAGQVSGTSGVRVPAGEVAVQSIGDEYIWDHPIDELDRPGRATTALLNRNGFCSPFCISIDRLYPAAPLWIVEPVPGGGNLQSVLDTERRLLGFIRKSFDGAWLISGEVGVYATQADAARALLARQTGWEKM